MKEILIIGLGSMGKRRIRNLFAIGGYKISGFDLRQDRCKEANENFGIYTYNNFKAAIDEKKYYAFIISVPPDKHIEYMEFAYSNQIPCFVEASVVDYGIKDLIEKRKKNNGSTIICPSCTMRFHPSIIKIKELINCGWIGKVSNFSYHSGQYLPDWHPWESINDYYVSNPITGGCREIVPFELTWMNWVFGKVDDIKGFYNKTIELNAPIDDTYTATIRYQNGILGTLVVDVVCRWAVRKLLINGESGQITWDWNENCVRYYNAYEKSWSIFEEPKGTSVKGYHSNLIEEMYIEEMKAFLSKIENTANYPHTLEEDYEILQLLYKLEQSDILKYK